MLSQLSYPPMSVWPFPVITGKILQLTAFRKVVKIKNASNPSARFAEI